MIKYLMISQTKITLYCIITLLFIFNLETSQDKSEYNEIRHEIFIKHPGEKYAVPTTLTEVQNKEGLPVEYHMAVESVICLAEVCKVIPVTLYWDNVGDYQRYELEKGATLEKYKADFFEPEDYKKLDRILKDNDSPFRDVFIEDIWNVPDTINENVDAISGATILQLDEKDTVPGAALTCYTLWHWANGNIVSVIKNQTGKSVSDQQLKVFISSEKEAHFNVALSALSERNLHSEDFTNFIIERVQNDDFLLREAFTYLDNIPNELYLKVVSKLFFNGDKPQKLAVIRSLKTSKNEISKSFYDELSSEFINLKSFQEVSTLIELMETKNPNSSIINKNVLPLLESEFLIARRAYWFLSNQENLTSTQEKKLLVFQKKNKERL